MNQVIVYFRALLVIAACCSPASAQFISSSHSHAPETRPTTEPANASPASPSIKALLEQGSDTKNSPEVREQAAAALIAAGEEGQRRLLAQSMRDFKTKRETYLAGFARGAADLLKARQRGGQSKIENEAGTLRQTVLGVARSESISKEAIVGQSDPAMKRLRELLTVDRQEVIDASPAWGKEREELGRLADWARRAAEPLAGKRPAPPVLTDSEGTERALAADESLAALLATPMPPVDRVTLSNNHSLAAGLDAGLGEAEVIERVNEIRILAGLNALAIDLKLCTAARGHGSDMVRLNFFSHESPVSGKRLPGDRAKLAGTTASGENIAYGVSSPEEVNMGWWHSPGHHANMMGEYRRIGVGREETHWTEMFGR